MTKSFFSIIIPVLEINDFITKYNLPALKEQIYDQFEVIILPNEVRAEDEHLVTDYPFLRLIPTHEKTNPSDKRNIGARQARGDVLAFIDDDAYPHKSWLQDAADIFDDTMAVLCGPGTLPKHPGWWERVFNALLCTRLGSANLTYRFQPEKPRFVDDFPTMNFLIRKEVFNATGGFDTKYWPGEDSKLCEEVIKRGGRIFYHPKVMVHHFRRNSLKKFLHQHAQYGEHRGAFFAQGDKNSRRWWYLIPTLFVIYITVITLIIIIKVIGRSLSPFPLLTLFSPLLFYFLLLLATALQSFSRIKNIKISLTAAGVIFLMHLTYGIFFLKGIITGRTGYARREI